MYKALAHLYKDPWSFWTQCSWHCINWFQEACAISHLCMHSMLELHAPLLTSSVVSEKRSQVYVKEAGYGRCLRLHVDINANLIDSATAWKAWIEMKTAHSWTEKSFFSKGFRQVGVLKSWMYPYSGNKLFQCWMKEKLWYVSRKGRPAHWENTNLKSFSLSKVTNKLF